MMDLPQSFAHVLAATNPTSPEPSEVLQRHLPVALTTSKQCNHREWLRTIMPTKKYIE